jgi:glycosyltransferase involved in cell wall biosynthesis
MELLRILQRRSFRRADGIIFLSEFAREMVAAEIGRQPDSATGFGTMIPHGVTEEFRSVRDSSEIRTLSNDDEISLLYVSSFDVYKNQETVLSAVNKVRDDGWNIKVRFVGPKNDYAFGEFSKQRSKLDPKGDWSSVVFEVSQRALREYYRESDFFVYASTCENLPNILLEAMAARIPILCSDARPMSDILGRGGRYFVPRDASSLSEAIVGAIASPQETKNAVQIAYERVSEYDWDICAQTTLSYLSECAR